MLSPQGTISILSKVFLAEIRGFLQFRCRRKVADGRCEVKNISLLKL